MNCLIKSAFTAAIRRDGGVLPSWFAGSLLNSLLSSSNNPGGTIYVNGESIAVTLPFVGWYTFISALCTNASFPPSNFSTGPFRHVIWGLLKSVLKTTYLTLTLQLLLNFRFLCNCCSCSFAKYSWWKHFLKCKTNVCTLSRQVLASLSVKVNNDLYLLNLFHVLDDMNLTVHQNFLYSNALMVLYLQYF